MKKIILKIEDLNGEKQDTKLVIELINIIYNAVKETEFLDKLHISLYECGHLEISWKTN